MRHNSPKLVDISTEEQIAHIKEHQAEFEAAQGKGRKVEDYFAEYRWKYEESDGFGGLYLRLCQDLGITPRGYKAVNH